MGHTNESTKQGTVLETTITTNDAVVDSIYLKNGKIRDEVLKHVWNHYNMMPDVLTYSMGKLYDVVNSVYIPPKNMKSLLNYTHDGSSQYSQRIKEKFMTAGPKSNEVAELSTIQSTDYVPWSEKYGDDGDFDVREFRKEYRARIKNAETRKEKKAIRKERKAEGERKRANGEWYGVGSIDYAKYMEDVSNVTSADVNKLSALQGIPNDIFYAWDEDQTLRETIGDRQAEYFDDTKSNVKGILSKTKELYNNHVIKTLSNRYYTGEENSKVEFIDTAKSRVGNSHGRNLLKSGRYKSAHGGDDKYGYDNPYCRVWTNSHQYKTYGDIIRSKTWYYENLDDNGNIKKQLDKSYKTKEGLNGTVLQKSGIVRITPNPNGDIKNCMFSITNLALDDYAINQKDGSASLTKTMWFPPYDLSFQETVSVQWDEKQFIGRGEPIYSYVNTKRSGTLSFTMLIDHPSILNIMKDMEKTAEGEDYENEVLRFFAGSGKTELKTKMMEKTTTERGIVGETEPREREVPNEDAETKQFSIYFPFNYAGEKLSGNEKPQEWVKYLYEGRNAANRGVVLVTQPAEETPIDVKHIKEWTRDYLREKKYFEKEEGYDFQIFVNFGPDGEKVLCRLDIKGNKEKYSLKHKVVKELEYDNHEAYELYKWNGYEMKDGGLYCEEDLNIASYFDSATCQGYMKFYHPVVLPSGDKKYDNGGKAHCFFYRTRRKTPCFDISDNCYDNKSFKLNSTAGENDFSFADIYKFFNEYNLSEQKLLDIFNNVNEVSFEIIGHYIDGQEDDDIGITRAKNVKSWIEGMGTDKGIYIVEITTSSKKEKIKDISVNSKSNKKARRVDVIIKVNPTRIETIDGDPIYGDVVKKYTEHEHDNVNNDTPSYYSINDEYTFFRDIAENDQFTYNKIIDKVKYFSPAYHSMTPEGFNKRLGFLHQCTRPGPTIKTGGQNGVAGNSVFGRAPFCELRIGDFINTTIVITSLSVSYENGNGIQWDLNPEGIGVQPMFAKVNMSIEILGGQSLEGPVRMLNNAISNNFYANTGAYCLSEKGE